MLTPLLAGALIGLAGILLLLTLGRVAGISGILGGLTTAPPADRPWRAWFIIGLIASGALLYAMTPEAFTNTLHNPPLITLLAGLLVGFGTRLGSGCTSGHGICGISRLSPRSITATLTFIAVGMITVTLIRGAA